MTDIIWEKIKKTLQSIMPESEYIVWINPLEGQFKNDSLKIFCPNKIIKERLQQKLFHYIHEAARVVTKNDTIFVEILSKPNKKKLSTQLHNRVDSNTGVNHSFTFSNFVKGQSNENAYACSKSVAKGELKEETLFVYGESSTGKTHLLNAIANEFLLHHPEKKVLLTYTKDFIKDIILSIRNGTMEQLSERLRSLDLLLIDDIHLIAGKARTQEEFFDIFQTLLNRNKKVIFVGDTYPRDVDELEPRIRNRVLQGSVTFIDLPELDTRLGILKEFARREGIEHLIPEEAYYELAQRIKKHARVLQQMIHTIKSGLEYSKIKQTASTETILSFVRTNLEHETVNSFSVDRIKKVVCAFYNINNQDLLSKSRSQRVLKPRQIAMYLVRKYTDVSLASISHAFNRKEHATAINACNKIEDKIKSKKESDISIRREISQIELILRR